jgi:hypothetical protein
MADAKRDNSPDSRETIRSGVQEIEHLIGRQEYHEAMIRAGETLKLMVDTLCAREDIPDGSLIERIDELENHGVLDKNAYERYNRIRMIASKAKHENDNSAYNANQIHRLLADEVSVFPGMDDLQAAGTGRHALREKGSARLAADRSERDNRFEREARQQDAIRRAKRAEKLLAEISDKDAGEAQASAEKTAPNSKNPESTESAENIESTGNSETSKAEAKEGISVVENASAGSMEAMPDKPAAESTEAAPDETPKGSAEATPEKPAESAEAVPEKPAEGAEAVPEGRDAASEMTAEEGQEEESRDEERQADERETLRGRLAANRSASRRRRAMNAGPSISPSAVIKPVLLIAIIIVLLVIIRLLQPAGDISGTAAETAAAASSVAGESTESGATDESTESGATDESTEGSSAADAETTAAESAETTAQAASETAAQTKAAAASYRVKADVEIVRVRKTPKTDDDTNIAGLLAAGDKVSYVGDQDDQWAIINYNGKEAYVAKQYLEKVE